MTFVPTFFYKKYQKKIPNFFKILKYIFSENSKIYNLRKIYISKFFKIIFGNFKIYISKFIFRKKISKYFRKFGDIYVSKFKTDFFFRKRSFLNFLSKKNLENSFIFKIWIQIYFKI